MSPAIVLLKQNIKRAKNFFSPQYPTGELERLTNLIKDSQEILKLYDNLENKFFPTSDNIIDSASLMLLKNRILSPLLAQNEKQIEKKVDYIHITSILILENWLLHILPNQNKNPTRTINEIENVEAGWMFGNLVFQEIIEKSKKFEQELLYRLKESRIFDAGGRINRGDLF